MLTIEELTYLLLTFLILSLFPFLTLLKIKPKLLIINLISQVGYSAILIWILENYGNKGLGLLWVFYWFCIISIHLVWLNIWTFQYRKEKN